MTGRPTIRALVALVALGPLVAVASLAATASPAAAAPPVGTVETIPLGPGISTVTAITAGPDGNTWFVSADDHLIGKVTPTGVVTTYTHPELREPADIVAGPDGNLWFVDRLATWEYDDEDEVIWTNGWIGRITPAGDITVFRDEYVREPSTIVAGDAGLLWFIDAYSDSNHVDGAVGSITTAGVIERGTWNDDSWNPVQLELDSEGQPWAVGSSGEVGGGGPGYRTFTYAEDVKALTLAAGNEATMWFIGRRFPSEPLAIMRFAQPDAAAVDVFESGATDPVDLLSGRDGSVWFADAAGSVGLISATGELTTFPTPGATPDQLSWGPDGNVWFVDGTTIGRVTSTGVVTLFTAPFPIVDALEAGGDGSLWFRGAGASVGRIAAADVSAPIFVEATAGRGRVDLSWTRPPAPTQLGGYYLVQSTPAGFSCQTGTTACVFTGNSWTPGTAYTFTVQYLSNIGGTVLGTSSPSNAVVPWSGSAFHPVAPTRILDSRPPGIGFAGPVTSAQPGTLTVTGLGGASNVPASATAVVMNVTVTDSTHESFLTVYPTGDPKPNASNLNFGAGQVSANLVTVKLGSGRVDIATAVGSTNVVADVVGYYDDGTGVGGGRFLPVTPTRLLDTRIDPPEDGGPVAPVAGSRELPLRQKRYDPDDDTVQSVPWTARAAVVNVTIVDADSQSFLRLTPQFGWSTPPDGWGTSGAVSNLNFLPGQIVANLAIVGGDSIRITNAVGSVHVIVDLVGYLDATGGSRFHAMTPNRVLDTRTGAGLAGKQGAGQTRALAVAGAPGTGVPAGATALVANLTTADATSVSFASVFPGDVARPDPFSNLNFAPGQVVPNLTTSGLAPDGTLNLYNHLGQTHLIADAVGWFAPY